VGFHPFACLQQQIRASVLLLIVARII